MTKINLQFHATREEIIEFIKTTVDEYNLFLITVELFPEFKFKMISTNDFMQELDIIRNSRMIFLRLDKPELTFTEYNKLLKENQNSLVFSLGKQTDTLLEEFSLSTMVTEPETLILWKKIINGFKRILMKGAWVVDSISGNMRFYKNHYYTPLSQRMFMEGLKIVQFQQSSCYYVLCHQAPDI